MAQPDEWPLDRLARQALMSTCSPPTRACNTCRLGSSGAALRSAAQVKCSWRLCAHHPSRPRRPAGAQLPAGSAPRQQRALLAPPADPAAAAAPAAAIVHGRTCAACTTRVNAAATAAAAVAVSGLRRSRGTSRWRGSHADLSRPHCQLSSQHSCLATGCEAARARGTACCGGGGRGGGTCSVWAAGGAGKRSQPATAAPLGAAFRAAEGMSLQSRASPAGFLQTWIVHTKSREAHGLCTKQTCFSTNLCSQPSAQEHCGSLNATNIPKRKTVRICCLAHPSNLQSLASTDPFTSPFPMAQPNTSIWHYACAC